MSKLSFHISNWLDADTTFDLIEKMQPAVVKVFADGGLDDMKIAEARRRSPKTLWVGRKYFPEQILERIDDLYPGDAIHNYDPNADAQNVFQQMQNDLTKFKNVIDVWEGLNEVPIDTEQPLTERNHDKARAFSAFTVALAKLIHGVGEKYAAYSFSTGNPVHVELWDDLLDGLCASDYLALHEYIAPDEPWQNFYTGMCNGYRAVYARVPINARRPVLITECGDDYLGSGGYQGRISNDMYLAQLKAYDAELMKDPLAVGAAIFCYGVDDKRWKTYDIGGALAHMLADYVAATPTPAVEVKTEPEKPEPAKPEPQKPEPQEPEPVEPPVAPVHPDEPQPALAVNDARWWTEEATRQIEAKNPDHAHAILTHTVIPWFYASAPQYAPRPAAAQAQGQARWFTEEAVRKLEAKDLQGARNLLKTNVIPWFYWQ